MRIIKYAVIFISLMLIVAFLSGCSDSAKRESDIIKDLQVNEAFISPDIEISDYEIIRRQTDKTNRSDVVYVTVRTNDERFTSTLSYVLNYELYNNGWLLESANRYYDGPWEFSGLEDGQLLSDIKDNDYYFTDWYLTVEDIEITGDEYISSESTFFEKYISVDLTAHGISFDYYATYNLLYEVVDGIWELQYVKVQNREYAPTYSPYITASDKIVETLKVDRQSSWNYDSYEYLETEADWRNCTETRYYTATKDWWFGTETYLISIPLHYTLENGEDESVWAYDKSEIKSVLYDMEWNIEGTAWTNKYEPSDYPYTYITVDMEINNIVATDDAEVYTVNLSCDASSSKYYYLCKTYGDVDARIKYGAPGRWILYIDDTIATIDNNKAWSAFDLIGYSAGATHEGFSWLYSSIGNSSSECQLKQTQ